MLWFLAWFIILALLGFAFQAVVHMVLVLSAAMLYYLLRLFCWGVPASNKLLFPLHESIYQWILSQSKP